MTSGFTGDALNFFGETDVLFGFARRGRRLIRIELAFAVLLRTFARVTEHTYRKLEKM